MLGGTMVKKKKKTVRLTTRMKGRLSIVFAVIVCLFLVLVGRLIYWNVVRGGEFSTKVLENQESSSTTIPYERGKIYDRNGNTLATNEKKYTLILEPKNILSSNEKYLEHTVDVLNQYLKLDKKQLKSYIRKHKDSYYEVYKKDLTYSEVSDLQDFLSLKSKSTKNIKDEKEIARITSAQSVKGVLFEESYDRVYPYKDLACRVLGFTLSGNVGTWGIEQYYNSDLNGVDGRSYAYLNQELVTEKTIKEPENGKSVVSTIDIDVQKIIEEQVAIFDDKIGSSNTSVLVMDPNNGEILAMASSYSYDLNDPMNEKELRQIYTAAELNKMKEYTKQVLEESNDKDSKKDSKKKDSKNQITIYDAFSLLERNPIISDANEPGSTYKPVTVGAGLESGILTGKEEFYCTGSLTVADRNIGCSHVHGSITLEDAVAQSCNVAMMNIAFKEGAETFYRYQNEFGFGQKTGIDLPGEANTRRLVYNASNYDNDATLATNSFGQNFNSTMIQMASAYNALINGGLYYQPHVAKQILSPDGNVVEEIGTEVTRNIISNDTSDRLRKYMQSTVTSGTAKIAAIPGYSVGGKTGTAEKIPRNKKDYYISFIAFTPVENPELLIYVTIDEPNIENQASANLAVELERRCMTKIVEVMGIQPDNEQEYETAKLNADYELYGEPYEGYDRKVPKKKDLITKSIESSKKKKKTSEEESAETNGEE